MKPLMIGIYLLSATTSAFIGNDRGNGGDTCEKRILEIRDDIVSWIDNGGSKKLKFPNDISLDRYNTEMLHQLKNAKVSCIEDAVSVGSSEKTCMNKNGLIKCNFERFMMRTDEQQQYILIHHEYAGLAGFETNNAEESNYRLSNQLSAFLTKIVISKLSINRRDTQVIDNYFEFSAFSISNINIEEFIQGKKLFLQAVKKVFSLGFLPRDGFYSSDKKFHVIIGRENNERIPPYAYISSRRSIFMDYNVDEERLLDILIDKYFYYPSKIFNGRVNYLLVDFLSLENFYLKVKEVENTLSQIHSYGFEFIPKDKLIEICSFQYRDIDGYQLKRDCIGPDYNSDSLKRELLQYFNVF